MEGDPGQWRGFRVVLLAVVLVAGFALVLWLNEARPVWVESGPEAVRRGMDRAQVRRIFGTPLESGTAQDRSGPMLETWTYKDRKVFFLNGFVKDVVPFEDGAGQSVRD